MGKKTKRFDYLNLFYGIGAAIILTAAMFKFVGWKFANEIFIIGITIEAFVFLASSFNWTEDDESYRWERVFPQLRKEDLELENATFNNTQIPVDLVVKSIQSIDKHVADLNEATKRLSNTVDDLEHSYKGISNSTQSYQIEIDQLRAKMKKVNENLKILDDLNINN